MSMCGDIIGTFKAPVAEGKLEVETAARMFLGVLSALEWDIEDWMEKIPSDLDEYLDEEFKTAVRILSR